MDSNEKCFDSNSIMNVNVLKKHSIENNGSPQFRQKSNFNNEIDVGNLKTENLQKKLANAMQTNDSAVDNCGETVPCKNEEIDLNEQVLPPIQTLNAKPDVDSLKDNVDTMQTKKIIEQKDGNSNNLTKLTHMLNNLQLSKIFASKQNKIAIMVVLLAVVLVLFLNLSSSGSGVKTTNASTTFNSLEYVSSKAYVENLEQKLMEVLSNIKGAGSVNVMITLESGPELKIATSVDERTNTSTSSSTTTTSVTVVENPIIITQNGQSSPLVLMEIMPVVKGVVVVAEGAGNTKTKLELLEAVQALLNISNNNIQIYAGI